MDHQRFLNVVAVMLLLAACASRIGNPDWTEHTNKQLAGNQPFLVPETSESNDQHRRLWRDRPDYVALVDRKHLKDIRVISAVVPKYPTWLQINRVKAIVTVSFVVGVDGKVEDARIAESSDDRFNSFSIEAIRQFKFIPAEGSAGPESAMAAIPFKFGYRPLIHESDQG